MRGLVLAALIAIAYSDPKIRGPGDTGHGFDIQMLLQESVPPHVKLEPQFFFHRAEEPRDYNAITLSLQGDVGRIQKVADHARRWKGPVVAALLIRSEADKSKAQHFIGTADADTKKHVDIHLAINPTPPNPYPINAMRNLALSELQTEWVMVIDIDEDTVFDMDTHARDLHDALRADSGLQPSKSVFVSTSYQWTNAMKAEIPHSKEELVQQFDSRAVVEKHPEWIVAYQHPQAKMSEWRGLTHAKRVDYVDWYEPYFIARSEAIPRFDDTFAGFGFNAHEQAFEMAATGFQYVVLPNVFNFARETATEAAKTSKQDGSLGSRAAQHFWGEVGAKHGCSKCQPGECFASCPAFHKNNKPVFAAGTGSAKLVATGVPVVQPEPHPHSSGDVAPGEVSLPLPLPHTPVTVTTKVATPRPDGHVSFPSPKAPKSEGVERVVPKTVVGVVRHTQSPLGETDISRGGGVATPFQRATLPPASGPSPAANPPSTASAGAVAKPPVMVTQPAAAKREQQSPAVKGVVAVKPLDSTGNQKQAPTPLQVPHTAIPATATPQTPPSDSRPLIVPARWEHEGSSGNKNPFARVSHWKSGYGLKTRVVKSGRVLLPDAPHSA